ncbi:PepSY domain-containing protein [Ammoniphilus sp. 3BR4]|uniref:PepSY domain-containing protein n=1 Tax=Ammoniphilus sp. 3BR4 TaxID=3158265 RepID=UPI003465427E
MKQKFLVGVLSATVILGSAVAAGAANKDIKAVNPQNATEGKEIISIEEAQKIAQSKAEGYVESLELESRLGKPYYDVDIENKDLEYDIHIDAYTGEVLSVKEKINDDDDGDRDDRTVYAQSSNQNLLSEKQATEIAEKAANGTVREMKLDEEDGRMVYEFEFVTSQGETEIEIDAVTGKVLKMEHDDN